MGGPICIKLLEYIQFNPGFCMEYFSTSGQKLETGNKLFFENRKFQLSKPEVENQPTSGLEVLTGCRKVPRAIALVELFTKFHANRSTRLGGNRFTHIKNTASKL